MGLFNNLFGKTETPTEINLGRERDLQDFKNQQSDAEVFKLLNEITKASRQRIKADIQRWKEAIALAENVDNPQRWALKDLYKDAMLDHHVSSIIQTRQLMVSSTKFKVVDKKTGEEDEEKTRLLSTPWFHKYLGIALDARFFGTNLIEFGTPKEGELQDVQLIPGSNFIPEFGIVTKEVGDDKGISIEDPEYIDWLIQIGDCEDLGILYKVVPLVIMKRNAMWAWSEFIEIFGMPFRWATTASRDTKVNEQINNTLAEMGQASHATFPDGVEINFEQQKHSDAHQVYDAFINRINSEISKLILGQTMTSDNGSSQSQANIHMAIAENIVADDRMKLEFHISIDLFKKLNIHGYQFGNDEFKWDTSKNIDAQERIKIDAEISDMGYTPTKEYLEKTYNIELDEKTEKQVDTKINNVYE